MKQALFISVIAVASFCNNSKEPKKEMPESTNTTIGTLEKYDEALDAIVSPNAKAEIIAESFEWSEGPLWIEKHQMLLFSDVPKNTIYKWTEKNGKEIYLTPSGYTGAEARGGETGSNGLLLDQAGNLVLCQHGNRQMARMNASLENPKPDFIPLANKYDGKRFSSPNDAVYNSKGELFFTDPPYGLEKQANDPKKEIPFQGVYKVKTNGEVILLVDSITRPNGIAFLPGEKQLIVANSDPAKPNWYIFDVLENGLLQNGRIFYSAVGHDKSWRGLPDGFKIDKNGNVIATGPGGVYFFNNMGKKLGMLRLDNPTSNIALSADEKTIFITNDMFVLRMKMRD